MLNRKQRGKNNKHRKIVFKCYSKQREGRKKKLRKIILLAKSKLNSIEKIISMALIDSDISHNEFTLMITGE